ncbi:hypothetical protein STEG23_030958, partial [Scotinomys teguina]
MDLCRRSIRSALGRQRLRDIGTLPLPQSLKNYLQYHSASPESVYSQAVFISQKALEAPATQLNRSSLLQEQEKSQLMVTVSLCLDHVLSPRAMQLCLPSTENCFVLLLSASGILLQSLLYLVMQKDLLSSVNGSAMPLGLKDIRCATPMKGSFDPNRDHNPQVENHFAKAKMASGSLSKVDGLLSPPLFQIGSSAALEASKPMEVHFSL